MADCAHENVDRMRPSNGAAWWECSDCGVVLEPASPTPPAPDAVVERLIKTLLMVMGEPAWHHLGKVERDEVRAALKFAASRAPGGRA